jgi:hypothetical protein
MVRKLILLLPVLLGAAVALADGPVTEATASSESEKAVTAEVAK